MRDVILTCAVTGNITRPEQTPYLPITPQAIAESALEAAAAGAAIVHIHVRHPDDGRPSMETAHYVEVVERIRARNSDLILNLTTGPGGRYNPRSGRPEGGRPGHHPAAAAGAGAAHPGAEAGDLHPGPQHHELRRPGGDEHPPQYPDHAQAMLASGSKPEIEIFNPGDMILARELIEAEAFAAPALFSFVLGVKYGWPSTLESIQLGRSLLPQGAVWSAFGVGPGEFPMVALSALLGGHVRVGLEDNLYLERGVLARSNAELCEKAVRILRDLASASPRRRRRAACSAWP